jgi:ribulose-phosphate 3-epimerase
VTRIAPSIIAADAMRLREECLAVAAAGADMLHVDVMDGTFVPNITLGPWIHEGLRRAIGLPLDTHLMVEEPLRFLEDYRRAGADSLTVHVEACTHLHRTLRRIRELGARAGVAVNPGTSLSAVDAVLGDVDLVLVMSVNPGFAGQPFIESALDRVRTVADWRRASGLQFDIEVDGGVTAAHAGALRSAGADILVAGSSVFRSDHYAGAIAALRG